MSKEEIFFDQSKYADNDKAIAEYLSQFLKEGNIDEFMLAIGYIAKAKGMRQISDKTGLGRQSLYKTFKPGTKPRFCSVDKVIRSLGFNLCITAAVSQQ